jgi:hypothetical protein
MLGLQFRLWSTVRFMVKVQSGGQSTVRIMVAHQSVHYSTCIPLETAAWIVIETYED